MAAALALLPAAKLALGKAAAQTGVAALTKATSAAQAHGVDAATEKKLRKTANEFETLFLEQSMERMFSGLGEEGPLGNGGTGGDVWRSMLAGEYAKGIVRNGGVGISESIYSELLKLQSGGKA
ncbi:MAG: rod-binding protein [Beijerinckiaceae bacterium]